MLMPVAPLVLALVADVSLGLSLQPPVGVSAEEADVAHQKIVAELTSYGLAVTQLPAADAACVADASCVETARQALAEPVDAMLVVEFVRVGPVMQLTATGAAGEEKVNASWGLDEAQLASGPVL